MSSRPLVSVVLPVHNGEAFLGEAIESIRQQTIDDLELVVVDDGSTDGSAEIVRRTAHEDPRIRLVRRRIQGGLPVALNAGLAAARGEWIARLDADDHALPHRLARQLEAAARHPQVVVWAAWAHTVDVRGRVIGQISTGPVTETDFRRAHAAGFVEILHPTVLVRRKVLQDVGGYDPRFAIGEDIELWDRVGEVGAILTLPECLIRFRVHPGSESTRRMAESLLVHRFVRSRRAARDVGGDLSWEEFVRVEDEAPFPRRLLQSLSDRAAVAYREAGVAYASGEPLRAIGPLVLAAVLRPVWVGTRLWRQVVGPRLGRYRGPA